MLRLLYLLLRQRLRRLRPATPTARVRSGYRHAFRAGVAITVLAGVALTIALWPRGDTTDGLVRAAGTATLELDIRTIGSSPLVVYLSAPGTAEARDERPRSIPARLTSANGAFHPTFQVVPLTTSIEVGNEDTIPHNAHLFDGRRTIFNVATPFSGVRVRKVLHQPGIFQVRCDMHPWMRAWVFVPANPHYAVLREPGRTRLHGIPPGRYRLHVWEPERGEVANSLVLSAGRTASLSFPGG